MYQNNKNRADYDPLTDNPLEGDDLAVQPEKASDIRQATKPFNLSKLKTPIIRIATGAFTLALIITVVLLLKSFFLPKTSRVAYSSQSIEEKPTSAIAVPAAIGSGILDVSYSSGIPRLAMLHTIIPERPRIEIEKYTVQEGDNVFRIAEKFGLKPQTILWSNYYSLLDNPSFLKPGQILNILPLDGVYHKWNAGDGLNGVAKYFGVTPEDIINYPLNNLDLKSIGDYKNPNITPGAMLVIPNGTRSFITWDAPRITRENPGIAKEFGPGFCGEATDGPVGIGSFIWPTNNHFISGYDYSPESNHLAIDLDGETGDPLYAMDNGVVIYSGWSDWGYGNEVLIDHGNGWQTLYAHLSQINVGCGAWVYQGAVIGYMGSTGRSSGSHLHLAMIKDGSALNPWSYLPPP